MKVFQRSSKIWKIYGIYLNENSSKFIKYISILSNIFILIYHITLLILYFAYYMDKNIDATLRFYSLQEILATFTAILPYFSCIFLKNQITNLIIIISELITKR